MSIAPRLWTARVHFTSTGGGNDGLMVSIWESDAPLSGENPPRTSATPAAAEA